MSNIKELRKLGMEDMSDIVFSNFYSNEKKMVMKSLFDKKAFTASINEAVNEGLNFDYTDGIGGCPEYDYLNYDDMVEGKATTLFIDLVNFTARSLHASEDIEELKKLADLKKKFINSCILAVSIFNGHVHDISGDGIMCFFHRDKEHENVNNALLAGMFMIIGVKEYLNKELRAEDPDHRDIQVRVGVDTGDIIWTKMGNMKHFESCETKAVGFSVDMAAKLSGGLSWELKIGDNIYNMGNEEFIEYSKERYDDYKRTIDGKTLIYKRYYFNWDMYSKKFNSLNEFLESKLPLIGFPVAIEEESIPQSVNLLEKPKNKEVIFG